MKLIKLIFLSVVLLIVLSGCSKDNNAEYSYEMADLQGMRGAEATVMMAYKDSLPNETAEYWYDPNSFELIAATNPKPNPSGMGRRIAGGAIKDFEKETGLHYDYDESIDYKNKIIHVIVSNDNGKFGIKVDWVDAK